MGLRLVGLDILSGGAGLDALVQEALNDRGKVDLSDDQVVVRKVFGHQKNMVLEQLRFACVGLRGFNQVWIADLLCRHQLALT